MVFRSLRSISLAEEEFHAQPCRHAAQLPQDAGGEAGVMFNLFCLNSPQLQVVALYVKVGKCR